MKLLVFLYSLFLIQTASGQDVQPAPPDKAVVYFVRTHGYESEDSFAYFDSLEVIGTFNAPKYLRYITDPGHHIFWARSENRDYIRANLEAGKIYIIDVIPSAGFGLTRVKLVPVNSPDYKLKQIQKLVSKRTSEHFSFSELNAYQRVMSDVIGRGMERLEQENYARIPVLGSYSVEPEDFKFKKKKKKKKKR